MNKVVFLIHTKFALSISAQQRLLKIIKELNLAANEYAIYEIETLDGLKQLYAYIHSDLFDTRYVKFITFGRIPKQIFDNFFETHFNCLNMPNLKNSKKNFKTKDSESSYIKIMQAFLNERL